MIPEASYRVEQCSVCCGVGTLSRPETCVNVIRLAYSATDRTVGSYRATMQIPQHSVLSATAVGMNGKGSEFTCYDSCLQNVTRLGSARKLKVTASPAKLVS